MNRWRGIVWVLAAPFCVALCAAPADDAPTAVIHMGLPLWVRYARSPGPGWTRLTRAGTTRVERANLPHITFEAARAERIELVAPLFTPRPLVVYRVCMDVFRRPGTAFDVSLIGPPDPSGKVSELHLTLEPVRGPIRPNWLPLSPEWTSVQAFFVLQKDEGPKRPRFRLTPIKLPDPAAAPPPKKRASAEAPPEPGLMDDAPPKTPEPALDLRPRKPPPPIPLCVSLRHVRVEPAGRLAPSAQPRALLPRASSLLEPDAETGEPFGWSRWSPERPVKVTSYEGFRSMRPATTAGILMGGMLCPTGGARFFRLTCVVRGRGAITLGLHRLAPSAGFSPFERVEDPHAQNVPVSTDTWREITVDWVVATPSVTCVQPYIGLSGMAEVARIQLYAR